jgi:hypothetical protein
VALTFFAATVLRTSIPTQNKKVFIPPGGDRLCRLVVRVLDCISRGPGFDSRALQKKVVGLERGPLSLVSTTEELLDTLGRYSSLVDSDHGV